MNPLALEEFAALEQRHLFLTEQLTDLANTRKDLLTIIEEIDGKMESIFRSAFDDTQAAFAEVFPVLFPGGVGSITLTDPENMLTTGIEVSVKPAGKKIERLSLLSGGERSLAAVALLIAIFKARPSPFYIMDEVEAALDDANLGRLLTTMESLRDDSPAHRDHAPEAHDGDRRRPLRRLDAAGRRLGRRRAARARGARGEGQLSRPASAAAHAPAAASVSHVSGEPAVVGFDDAEPAVPVGIEVHVDAARARRARTRRRRTGRRAPPRAHRAELERHDRRASARSCAPRRSARHRR